MADWLGAGAGVASGALGLLGGIGSGKRAKKLLSKQEESQARLNEQNALLNYEYGEKSADSAQERSLALLEAEKQANSYQEKVAQAKDAGLSVGLLYGGGGAGGGGASATTGAQGGGAGAQEGRAPNYLEVESQKIANKQANAEIARTTAEAALLGAQKENIKADTGEKGAGAKQKESEANLNIEQTESIKKLRPVTEELLKNQSAGKFLENAEAKFRQTGEFGEVIENSPMDREIAIGLAEGFARVELNQATVRNIEAVIEEIESRTDINLERIDEIREGINTMKANQGLLNALANKANQEAQGYWTELMVAVQNGDSNEITAKAKELAVKFETGEHITWKTWANMAKGVLGGGAVLGIAAGTRK